MGESVAAAVTIRAPRAGDGAGLADAWLDTGRYYADLNPEFFQIPGEIGLADWMEQAALGQTSDDAFVRVADLAGEVVGYVWASFAAPMPNAARQFVREVSLPRIEVQVLIVRRAHWRRGIGTALMGAAEEWGRAKGAVVVLLDTYVDSLVSVPFYEGKMGYGRRALRFRKRLA